MWRNSRWSQKHKLIWTGAVAGVFVVGMIASSLIHTYVARNFAEANQLWEAGQRAEAVEKYRPMLKRDLDFLSDSDKPTVFQRVIEYEAENGNDDEATRIIELAKMKKIPISLESPQALTLLTKIEEKQKEAARLAAQKRRSREKLPAFEAIVSKLESFPDRLADVTERRKYNDELRKLVDDFGDIPFDAVQYSDDARTIVELYEEQVEKRYQGHTFDILDAHVRGIIHDLLSR